MKSDWKTETTVIVLILFTLIIGAFLFWDTNLANLPQTASPTDALGNNPSE